jgi:hypothetical protein
MTTAFRRPRSPLHLTGGALFCLFALVSACGGDTGTAVPFVRKAFRCGPGDTCPQNLTCVDLSDVDSRYPNPVCLLRADPCEWVTCHSGVECRTASLNPAVVECDVPVVEPHVCTGQTLICR